MPPPGTVLVVSLTAGLLAKATGITIDLDLAALLTAFAGVGVGLLGYRRLKAERPKIVEEITNLQQTRLENALKAAWAQVDRLEEDLGQQSTRADALEASLARAHHAIGELRAILEAAGLEVPELAL